jgi:curved DNA-binding protein CbpA
MLKQINKTPVPIIYRDILKNKMNGELTIRGHDFTKILFFLDGNLAFAKTTKKEERFGEILLELRKINQSQFLEIKDLIDGEKDNLGRILVNKKIINNKDIYIALIHQIKTIAISTFSLPSVEWDFNPHVSNIPSNSKFDVDLLEIINEGINKISDFSFYKNKFLSLAVEVSSIPENIKKSLSTEDYQFYEKLSDLKNRSTDQIFSELKIKEEFFWKKIILFYILNIVSFYEIKIDENLEQNIEELLELYEKIKSDKINLYQLLNIENNATQDEIKDAYFKLAKKYHPDRISTTSKPETQEIANLVFASINQAFETLRDEDQKRKYDKESIVTKNKTYENLIERAKILYRKAKTLYNKQQYWESSIVMNEAVKYDSSRSSYLLLLGLSQMNVSTLKREAEKNLKKAVDIDPWNAEPLVALGKLYFSENMIKSAENYFKKALSVNPEHALATKKLEEITNKHSKKTKPPFSFLFKKKKN